MGLGRRTSRCRGAAPGRALALCWALAALASGCCATGGCDADSLPLTRHLESVYDTVDFVRYAVRWRCWDALYEVLSARTREHGGPDGGPLGRFDFTFAFPRATYGDLDPHAPPELRDVKLAWIVHKSQILNVVENFPRPGEARVFLRYEPIELSRLGFPLINEGTAERPRWTLGLVEWAEEQSR
ncbi:MAG: hypothetical protein KatS3mg102_2906 [Planctomycetota bacterium]|nr:MAG: hypothetical protein KatS3mg102_2906 [Planctomycetota bacterium]